MCCSGSVPVEKSESGGRNGILVVVMGSESRGLVMGLKVVCWGSFKIHFLKGIRE